ncbi:MAG: hypothetical protein K8S55_03380 [Phycisphaerae bacterium]|nr:hypothetical protein [Phycisphaerae bacterium]
MSVSKLVRQRFEKRYGCTIEEAANHTGGLSQLVIPKKHKIHAEEIVGRGYVHFGKGVDAEKLDKESRKILQNW